MIDDEHQIEKQSLATRDQLVICAGTAAANILAARGLDTTDIANGLLAFAGAMMIDLVGVNATADVFASKADALREKLQ